MQKKYPYIYLKSEPQPVKKSTIKLKHYLGVALILSGVSVFIFFVGFPMFNQVMGKRSYEIVSAVGEEFMSDAGEMTALSLIQSSFNGNSNFFPYKGTQKEKYFFTLSIPVLGIKNAQVEANSTNTNPSEILVHILGTAEPGSSGNTFITGHSSFKYLFDPTDYKQIFSTLEDLSIGDEIIINVDNTTYRYEVMQKEKIKPQDVSLYKELFPKFLNRQTVTLMTCWPGGTTSYRLLVTAQLAN
ncbi:sortase [Patescibacteria group bacterium]|nr:sortase [Patescibacteria group bacterium]